VTSTPLIESLSPADAKLLLRHIEDFPSYAEMHWKIQPKVGVSVPFRLNNLQKISWYEIQKQRKAGKPVRCKQLKFRQGGMSTFDCGLMQHGAQTENGCVSLSVADKADLPAQWIRRARQWHEQTPEPLRPKLESASQLELYSRELNSRYYIGSAEGKTPGMGYTIRRFHGSEIANWLHPGDVLDDLMPAIPHHPSTWVIFESTGELVGDYWHKSWWSSRRGEDDYVALFLPWFIHEEYVADASLMMRPTPREEAIVALGEQWAKDNPEHAGLIGFKGVSRENLAWRRITLLGEPFYADDDAWACKYPSTPEEAFQSGGRQEFKSHELAKVGKTVRPPVWKGEIVSAANPAEFKLVGTDAGHLWIWDHDPSKGELPKGMFALGADVQWGTKGPGKNDYNAAYTENIRTGQVGMGLRGQWHMGIYAKMLASLGYYYNQAVLAPERNSEAAEGVVLPMLGLAGNDWKYPNLFVRARQTAFGGLSVKDYGWLTDGHTKPELIAHVHEAIDKGCFDGCHERVVAEMHTYIIDEQLRWGAASGCFDDCFMARAITSRVAFYERMRGALDQDPAKDDELDWERMNDATRLAWEQVEKAEEAEQNDGEAGGGLTT